MDVTTRATAQGYTFPSGWAVEANTEPDTDARPSDYDCYDSADIAAWHCGAWEFVSLVVRVVDRDGGPRAETFSQPANRATCPAGRAGSTLSMKTQGPYPS